MRRYLPGFLVLLTFGTLTLTGCTELIAKLKNRAAEADAGDDAAAAVATAAPTAEPPPEATTATALPTSTAATPKAAATTDAGSKKTTTDAGAVVADAGAGVADAGVQTTTDAGIPTPTLKIPNLLDGGLIRLNQLDGGLRLPWRR